MRAKCDLCGKWYPKSRKEFHLRKSCRKRKLYLQSLAKEKIEEKPIEVIEPQPIEPVVNKKVVKKAVNKRG